MPWPIASDYAEAVQNTRHNCGDAEMQAAKPEVDSLQLPRARTGKFAAVFRMQSPKRDFAMRCFLQHFNDQEQRYAAISRHLKASKLPYTVGFDFLEEGIRVKGQWYPILKMEWIQGEPVHKYIQKNLKDSAKLLNLAKQLTEMLHTLQQASIAHGDLQNGNLLVSNDKLKLIDYDGMYVPGLAGQASHETGHRNFQHPRRNEKHFSSTLDNFSGWVIYVSLIALAHDPSIWSTIGVNNTDEQLLFCKDDFEHPNASKTIRLLTRHPNQTVQMLGNLFESILFMDIDQIPALDGQVSTITPLTIVPTIAMPYWLKHHVSQKTVSSTLPKPQTAQADTKSDTNLSWLLDSISTTEAVSFKTFASSMTLPRTVVALSALALVLLSLVLLTLPQAIVPSATAIITIMILNPLLLLLYYKRDAIHKETKPIQAKLAEQKLDVANLQASIAQSDDRKSTLSQQNDKAVQTLKKEEDGLSNAEQTEIDTAKNTLNKTAADINNRRKRIVDSESNELKRLQAGSEAIRIREIDVKLQSLKTVESNELNSTLVKRQNDHISQYLQSKYISSASIAGVGDRITANLYANGFRTAADISYYAVQRVDKVGEKKAAALKAWRDSHEQSARTTMPTSLPKAVHDSIVLKHFNQKQSLEQQRQPLQIQVNTMERTIKDKYTKETLQLNQEDVAVKDACSKQIDAIKQKYSPDYATITKEIIQATDALNKQLTEIDEQTKKIRKQVFNANWQVAHTQRELNPYKNISFGHYLHEVFFKPIRVT